MTKAERDEMYPIGRGGETDAESSDGEIEIECTAKDNYEQDKVSRMTMAQVMQHLQEMSGIIPGQMVYRDVLWSGGREMPGSQIHLDRNLWEASIRGWYGNFTDLVAEGAKLDATDDSRGHWTAMHFAATGADEMFVGCDDFTQAKTVRRLAQLGGDVCAATPDGWTPLHAAAARGHVAVLTRLVTLGADMSHRGPSGQSPLHTAARWGRAKAVRRLLDLGADPSKRDDANLTARDHAWYFLDKDGAEDINTTLAILNLCEPSPTSVATLKDALPSFPESAMVRHAPQREDKLLPDVGNEVTEEELEGPVAPESEEDSVPEDSGGPQVKMVECDLEGEGLGSGGHLPAFWDKSAWEKRRKAFSARSAEEKAEMEETRLLARKRKAEIAADEPQEEMPPAPMPLARRRGKAADEEGEWVDSEDPDDFDYRGKGLTTSKRPKLPPGIQVTPELRLMREAEVEEEEGAVRSAKQAEKLIPMTFRGGTILKHGIQN